MGGAPTASGAADRMPGAHSASVKQMKPAGGAFDHSAAVERSTFLQQVQRVMSSGTDISIRSPDAAREFVNLVKEASSRPKGPLIQIMQASVNKDDKQVWRPSRTPSFCECGKRLLYKPYQLCVLLVMYRTVMAVIPVPAANVRAERSPRRGCRVGCGLACERQVIINCRCRADITYRCFDVVAHMNEPLILYAGVRSPDRTWNPRGLVFVVAAVTGNCPR